MAGSNATHIMYHFPYSGNSIMARYSFALRGAIKPGRPEIRIREQPIDITATRQHLTEQYLCELNPKGTVPVLASVDGIEIIPDSVEISFKFAETYPSLIPTQHRSLIRRLLDRQHELGIFTLTVGKVPHIPGMQRTYIEAKLGEEGLSDRYRSALKAKLEAFNKHLDTLTPQGQEKAAAEIDDYLREVEEVLTQSGGPWILGGDHATALDAHLVPLIARLQRIGYAHLVPKRLEGLAERAMAGPEWEEIMVGCGIVPPAPLGKK